MKPPDRKPAGIVFHKSGPTKRRTITFTISSELACRLEDLGQVNWTRTLQSLLAELVPEAEAEQLAWERSRRSKPSSKKPSSKKPSSKKPSSKKPAWRSR